jgi:pimeloyl-ACP methyl ester carboxylesterase
MSIRKPVGSAVRSSARARLRAATPLSERRVELAGVSTAVLEGGAGPPLLLLHGQGEFWGVWLPVVDDLVRDHRLVLVDLPGHGASTVMEGRLDAGSVLRWVDALVEATCPAPPALVGHLLGGAIAARYAVTAGRRLSHLVLVDSMGLGWYRPSPRFAVPLAAFVARPTERSRDRLFQQCFLDIDRAEARYAERWDDVRACALDQARTSENASALRVLMRQLGVPAIPAAELDRIGAPTALVHGRHDLQVPLRTAERASRRHGWPLHVINDARDDPAAEQPEAFVAALRAALAGHPRAADEYPHTAGEEEVS